jgi:hypothetical protein
MAGVSIAGLALRDFQTSSIKRRPQSRPAGKTQ